jgi:hypothetical protein
MNTKIKSNTTENPLSNSLHFVMQSKGGAGKTHTAVLMAQYLLNKEHPIICMDTDPKNQSFKAHNALKAGYVAISENKTILQQKFDDAFERIYSAKGCFLVDTGSATFDPLLKYFKSNEILKAFNDSGKNIYIHCVINGGGGYQETLNSLNEVIQILDEKTKVVVWKNPKEGAVIDPTNKMKPEDSQIIKNAVAKNQICGIVDIFNWAGNGDDDYVASVLKMTSKRLIISEVNESTEFNFIEKKRLNTVVDKVFKELDAVQW